MNQESIAFFERIDPKKENGSIQAILSEGNLQALSFEATAKRIIMNLLNDRQAILNENRNMANYLKEIGHYNERAVFGETK